MLPFTIFIPLFLLVPCIVYLMDLSLRPHETYGWELEKPDFGMALQKHTGFSSYMRAIQVNPVAVNRKRVRPHIARTFPVQRRIIHV